MPRRPGQSGGKSARETAEAFGGTSYSAACKPMVDVWPRRSDFSGVVVLEMSEDIEARLEFILLVDNKPFGLMSDE